MEMSYLRGVCGATRWDGESNESVYEKRGIGTHTNRVMLSGGMDGKNILRG